MWVKDPCYCYHLLIDISFSLSLSDCIKLLPLYIVLTSGLAGSIKVLTSILTSVARSTKKLALRHKYQEMFLFFLLLSSFHSALVDIPCIVSGVVSIFIIFSTHIYIGSNIRDSFFLKLCILKVFIYVMLIKSFWNYHVFCFYLDVPSQLKNQPQPRKCSKWLESCRESSLFCNICVTIIPSDIC